MSVLNRLLQRLILAEAKRQAAELPEPRRSNVLRVLATLSLTGILAIPLWLSTPMAHAYVFDVCPSGLSGIASTVTSCPFADNVRATWYAHPSSSIIAYSPVTGLAYYMSCDSNQQVTLNIGTRLGVRCDGGNDAAVVFW